MTPSQLYPLDDSANEVILAPIQDPQIRPSLDLRMEGLRGRGVSETHTWASLLVTWAYCPPAQPAARLDFFCYVPSGHDFDRVTLCLTLPTTVSAFCSLQLDGQWRSSGQEVAGAGTRMEIDLPLPRGKRLTGIRTTLRAHTPDAAAVSFQWFGLAQSKALQHQLKPKFSWDPAWPGLIAENVNWSQPRFGRGLFFSEKDLPALRKKCVRAGWRDNFALLEGKARRYLQRVPEDDIGDCVPWSDIRYSRKREHGKEPFYLEALVLGFVGLIRQDEGMMRHAIRYLFSTVHTTHWCQSAESRLKGSTWDQRCFIEELSTTSVAILLDWFDFALTPRARDLIRQAIWDKGLAVIERDMMKYEYVYHMNQGPWFCRARVLGGLMLEDGWARVGAYVDRAFADQSEGMRNYVLADGGTDEGIGYFSLTMNAVLWTVMAYARARGKEPLKLLPPSFRHSEQFVATMSGMRPGSTLMDGDQSTDYFVGDTIPILAGLLPKSRYADLATAALARERPFTYFNHYVSDGLLAMVWGPERLRKPRSVVPVFSRLTKVGQLTSRRGNVRVHVCGCKAAPSHSHLDKGSFTVEIGEEPVLIDRGTLRYDDARTALMPRSCLHNVLTPCAADGSYPDQDWPLEAIIPQGRGDSRVLEARIRLDHVWRSHMRSYWRHIHSSHPHELIIRDKGLLQQNGQVAFHLQSRKPFIVRGKGASLTGSLDIQADWADSICQFEDGIDYRFEPVYHLVIRSLPLMGFNLETRIRI